jgi:hypothetical protein
MRFRKLEGFLFKIDYEKAYHTVNLDFLYEIRQLRGFSPFWIRLIKQLSTCGSVGVKINEVESDFFLTGKGLRQGDPLSPGLFNFVVDVFSKMLSKGGREGLIRGPCPDFVPRGVVCLQCADDTLLFLEKSSRIPTNMKWILTYFE